jgi:hypothetical protein
VQLPAIQYGDWKTVKKRMARVATQLKRGADLVDVMTADGMLDTEATPGVLAMFGIVPGPVPSFHCFMPWRTLWHDLYELREKSGDLVTPPSIEDAIFRSSLRASWGVLGLMAHDSQPWLYPKSRHRLLLHAALEVWPELDAVGERYAVGSTPRRLWSVPNNLHYVMANLGVPAAELNAPLPPEGPRALLRYVRPVQ